jgi:hypothetical protein
MAQIPILNTNDVDGYCEVRAYLAVSFLRRQGFSPKFAFVSENGTEEDRQFEKIPDNKKRLVCNIKYNRSKCPNNRFCGRDDKVIWNFHVAAMIGSGDDALVFDIPLFDRPVKASEWAAKMNYEMSVNWADGQRVIANVRKATTEDIQVLDESEFIAKINFHFEPSDPDQPCRYRRNCYFDHDARFPSYAPCRVAPVKMPGSIPENADWRQLCLVFQDSREL